MCLTEETQVIALLGGLGTRLRPTEPEVPKAMVDVHGKPFFLYQLLLMRDQGFRDFLFCVGYMGEAIEQFFGDGQEFGVRIKYSADGETPLGTGGALRNALPLLAEDFIVMYGDGFLDTDYNELIYNFRLAKEKRGKKGLLAVYKNDNKYCPSNVIFKDGLVLTYEKWNTSPGMEYIDFGASMLTRSVIEEIPEGHVADLADVYHELAEKGLLAGLKVRKRFYEIGTPESLDEFRRFTGERIANKRPAVLLDRDGTLNEIVLNEDTEQPDSPLKPDEMHLMPGTVEALRVLKSLGYLLVVVTNQPAAAKAKTTLGRLYEVNHRFTDLLAEEGVELDEVMMCPHHPVGSTRCEDTFLIRECDCRKPATGLIEGAIEKLNIDVGESYVIGDSYADILAGRALGIRTVYIGNFKCDTCKLIGGQAPDFVFESVQSFAEFLRDSKEVGHGEN